MFRILIFVGPSRRRYLLPLTCRHDEGFSKDSDHYFIRKALHYLFFFNLQKYIFAFFIFLFPKNAVPYSFLSFTTNTKTLISLTTILPEKLSTIVFLQPSKKSICVLHFSFRKTSFSLHYSLKFLPQIPSTIFFPTYKKKRTVPFIFFLFCFSCKFILIITFKSLSIIWTQKKKPSIKFLKVWARK